MTVLYFLLSASFLTTIKSQIFSGSSTIIGENTIDVSIDYSTQIVSLKLTGPSGVWNGFGFGSNTMTNTYSIIMEYPRDDLINGIVSEYTLGSHKAGSELSTTDIRVLSDITNGNIRSVSIERSITGTYTFPTVSTSDTSLQLDIISAIGSIPSDYATARNAVHTSRAYKSVTLTKITTKTPTTTTTATALNPTPLPSLNPVQTPLPSPLPNTTSIIDESREVIQCNDCSYNTIQCTTNKPCSIQCLTEKSCLNATLRCNTGFECLIQGLNAYALSGAYIVAPSGYDIDIECTDVYPCANIVIEASKASSVTMHCDAIKSCQDFEVFCPSNSDGIKHCNVIGNIDDHSVDGFSIHSTMKIHAANGWNDIDLSLYAPTMAVNGNNIMYCALDQCSISYFNGIWDCMDTQSLCAVYPQTTTTTTTTTTTVGGSTKETVRNECLNGDISTGVVSTGSMQVIGTLNCVDNTIAFDITYKGFNGDWFGLIFNTEMFGDALVFTTGKNNDRAAALYSYYIDGKSTDNVVYDASNDWTQLSMRLDIGSNGIRVIYQHDLDQTKWNKDTNVIQFNAAIGKSLTLQKHITATANTFDLHLVPIPTIAPTKLPTVKPTLIPTLTPTLSPTTSSPSTSASQTVKPTSTSKSTPKPTVTLTSIHPISSSTTIYPTPSTIDCPNGEILSGNIATTDLNVKITLNCVEEYVMMDITYNEYEQNWFGLVFNNEMFGNAVVYGSRPTNDANIGLYSYNIQSKTATDVIYEDAQDWTEILTQQSASNTIRIVYSQALYKTVWNKATKQITFRYAFGYTLNMGYHLFRSDEIFIMDLNEDTEISTTIGHTNDIICDDDNACTGTVIQCTRDGLNENNACVIQCVSSGSCSNTLFECLDGYDCYLLCIGDESCKQSTFQCGNNADCYVHGMGYHSLYEISVNGQIIGGTLSMECMGQNSCNYALIAGLYSDRLDIVCGAVDSCANLKMQCPASSNNTARCKLVADAYAGDGIHIFAVNSWSDLDTASYLPYDSTQNMYCGERYDEHCTKDDMDWNCNGILSPCFVEKDGVEVIRCGADGTCVNRTIYCDIHSNDCSMICDGFGSCSGSDIMCNNASKCAVICTGDYACNDVNIIQCGTSAQCDIECVGDSACSNTTIECGTNINMDSNTECVCNIHGSDRYALFNANIECLTNSNCSVFCASSGTCNNVRLYGEYSSFMNVLCMNGSCNNIELFCPSFDEDKRCVITGHADIDNEWIIYAKNSWDDVDLTGYLGTLQNNISSKMMCGDTYTDVCDISFDSVDGWQCVDDDFESLCYIPSASKTVSIPTTNSTDYVPSVYNEDMMTTMRMSHLMDGLARTEYIAIIVIICFVVIIILLLIVYCWCYKPNKPKYKSVKKKDDEMMPIGKGNPTDQAIVELGANVEQFSSKH